MMLNYHIIKVTLLLRLLEMVAFFKQISKIITWDRNIRRRYYFCWGITMTKLITINTKTPFLHKWKLFEPFSIKNDFAQYFAIYLFKSSVLYIGVTPWNNTFLHYRKNQLFLNFVFIMGYPEITWHKFQEIFFFV